MNNNIIFTIKEGDKIDKKKLNKQLINTSIINYIKRRKRKNNY